MRFANTEVLPARAPEKAIRGRNVGSAFRSAPQIGITHFPRLMLLYHIHLPFLTLHPAEVHAQSWIGAGKVGRSRP